jgi:hypothetical protein
MCAYYWSTINQLMLTHLEALPADAWMPLDYTASQADAVLRIARFCGLEGLSENRIQELLGKKINSLKDRNVQTDDTHPDWKNWNGGERRRFTALAGEGMKRLGYFQGKPTDWRPRGYGKSWQDKGGDLAWYQWMHDCRKTVHQDFYRWIADRERCGDAIESIADFGCGLGVGYCEQFAGKRFIGVELAQKNTDWCRAHRANPKHEFHCFDFMEKPLQPRADVVTSSGTIDNCYDIEAFLGTMLASANKWIYATCYRGWFPELDEHRYQWNPDHGCFYNDVSARRVEEYLKNRGCSQVLVSPLRTGNSEIPYETRIVARVP